MGVPVLEGEEWVRLPRPGHTLCGLNKAFVYRLCAQKQVRHIHLRQPGKKVGVILVHRPSVAAYLAAIDREQNGDLAGEKSPIVTSPVTNGL